MFGKREMFLLTQIKMLMMRTLCVALLLCFHRFVVGLRSGVSIQKWFLRLRLRFQRSSSIPLPTSYNNEFCAHCVYVCVCVSTMLGKQSRPYGNERELLTDEEERSIVEVSAAPGKKMKREENWKKKFRFHFQMSSVFAFAWQLVPDFGWRFLSGFTSGVLYDRECVCLCVRSHTM